MSSHILPAALLVLLVLLPGTGFGGPPQIPAPVRPAALAPTTRPEADRLLVRYSPRDLKDQDFADLAKAITEATPIQDWPIIRVRSNEGLLAIVDRAYDFYLQTPGDPVANPRTVAELVEIIRKANDLSSDTLQLGQTLRIPPMLARPMTRVGAIRPASGAHVSAQADGEALLYNVPGWDAKPFEQAIWSGRETEHGVQVSALADKGIRAAAEISLSLPTAQAQFLMQRGVVTAVPLERVSLELLEAANCSTAFAPSPYLPAAKARLKAALTQISQAAAKSPLVLIDYGFDGAHGTQVRHVVDGFLDSLGLTADVAGTLRTNIVDFDLNPRNSPPASQTVRPPLLKAMEAYTAYLQRMNAPFLDQRANASDWFLNAESVDQDRLIVKIAPFALQAAVAANLEAGAWLNLSWRGDGIDTVMPIRLDSLLENRDVFAVAAAGNEAAEIMGDRAPQNVAALNGKFVNVTHGTADGQVCGSRTGTRAVRVQLLTQGVSVDGQQKTVVGSSFASPIVAAAAWLKHLLDGTPAERMRQHLVASSSFLPTLNVLTVETKGVFDPARLLAGAGAHFVDQATGQLVPFETMTLDLGSCGSFSRQSASEPVNDLVIYERAGGFEVAVRTATPEFPHQKERDICRVPGLQFSARVRPGDVRTADTPQEFVAMVRQLHF